MKRKLCDNLQIASWNEKYNSEHENIRAKLLFAPNFSWKRIIDILGKIWYKKDIFRNTYVTDIGSWLSWLCFQLEWIAKEISLVDPLYGDEEREQKLMEWTEDEFVEKVFTNKNAWLKYEKSEKLIELYAIEEWMWKRFDKGQDLHSKNQLLWSVQKRIQEEQKKIDEKQQRTREAMERLQTEIKKDINLRRENKFIPGETIKLYGEDWQNIISLDDNSQDYVFINFLLDKKCVHPCKILAEWARILKPWGKIISINNNLWEKIDFFSNHNVSWKEESWYTILPFTKDSK